MLSLDFLGHLTNIYNLGITAGGQGIEYGTSLYETVGTVYWGFGFIFFLLIIAFGYMENNP